MEDLSSVFRDLKGGQSGAEERLFTLVYQELRRMAHQQMRGERRDGTYQTTVLVHEAYLKLTRKPDRIWENQTHFFGAAARAMRQILVDRAREKIAAKRGAGVRPVTLDENVAERARPEEVMALDEALEALEREMPRHARVVELRYFLGMTIKETAELLGIADRTVVTEWSFAKAWLKRKMSNPGTPGRSTDGD